MRHPPPFGEKVKAHVCGLSCKFLPPLLSFFLFHTSPPLFRQCDMGGFLFFAFVTWQEIFGNVTSVVFGDVTSMANTYFFGDVTANLAKVRF